MGFIKKLLKLLAAFNANVGAWRIAAGFACGFLMAVLPVGNLLWLALFILCSFVKMQRVAFVISLAAFKLAYAPIAPLADALGWSILDSAALRETFIRLAAAPIAPLTRFNNSLVMGGLALGLIAWIPLFVAFLLLVKIYRTKLAPVIRNSNSNKALRKLALFQGLASLAGKAASAAGGGL